MKVLQVHRLYLSAGVALFLLAMGCQSQLRLADGSTGLYDLEDRGPFNPSPAIYFMDGYSDATVRIRETSEKMTFKFWDRATSIAASSPVLSTDRSLEARLFLSAPEPLHSYAGFPARVPNTYRQASCLQLLQVISMNMKSKNDEARLLIGLPYAEKYPRLFFRANTFSDEAKDASSYGAMASLTSFRNSLTGEMTEDDNGYPARSVFAIYHILETPMGAFFNKKPTVMELQPSKDGKLALILPPIPFKYQLINGPIPLFDVNNPDGPPVADIVAAHHNSSSPARVVDKDSWPLHRVDMNRVRLELGFRDSASGSSQVSKK